MERKGEGEGKGGREGEREDLRNRHQRMILLAVVPPEGVTIKTQQCVQTY